MSVYIEEKFLLACGKNMVYSLSRFKIYVLEERAMAKNLVIVESPAKAKTISNT